MATGAKQIELEIQHVLKLIEVRKNTKASGRVAAQELDALTSRLNHLKGTLNALNGKKQGPPLGDKRG
jgi:hypothetical protein